MDYKKEIGRRLKAARKDADLTLEKAAEATSGVLSPSGISNYEQGLRLPGPLEINILAKVYHSDASYLMCLTQGDGEMTQEEIALLRDFRALPERERKDYARRIAALALVYKEPTPDERVSEFAAAERRKRKTKTP